MKEEEMKKIIVALGIVIILGGVIFWSQIMSDGDSVAPDFTITTTEGEVVNLSDFKGDKVVLIDFMATTCGPCTVMADEAILPLYEEELGNNSELEIISVSVWVDIDNNEKLGNHQDEKGFAWKHAMDSDDISAKYGAYEIPYVVIVDKTGNLTYKNNGVASYETLRSEVDLAISGEGGVAKVAELPTPALAIILGVVTFFSPCSFPLLPGYFSYYFSRNEKKDSGSKLIKALMSGLASASGIMVVFVLIALLFIPFSQIVAKYLDELNPIVGTILLLMGIVMITGYDINWMLDPIRSVWNRITGGRDIAGEKSERGGLSGLFFYGFGYGSAAAGCMAPIFLALLAATMKDGLIDAIIVFVLFSISAAIFMVIFTILAAYSKDTVLNLMRGSVGRIEQGGGAVMMIVGMWLLYQYWKVVSVS